MDYDDFGNDSFSVVKMDPVAMENEEKYIRGMWIMRVFVGFNILRAIISVFLGSFLVIEAINVACYVFLYKGVLWLRILLAVGCLQQAYFYYIIYTVLAVAWGLLPAMLIVLPFMLVTLAIPFLLFLQPSIVHFLTEQRKLNYSHLYL